MKSIEPRPSKTLYDIQINVNHSNTIEKKLLQSKKITPKNPKSYKKTKKLKKSKITVFYIIFI